MSNTSNEYIERVLNAAPFADNDAGIPQMCDLIRALNAERTRLQNTIDAGLEAELASMTTITELRAEITSMHEDLAGESI